MTEVIKACFVLLRQGVNVDDVYQKTITDLEEEVDHELCQMERYYTTEMNKLRGEVKEREDLLRRIRSRINMMFKDIAEGDRSLPF